MILKEKKDVLIKGLDARIFDAFVCVCKEKHGKSRGKYSIRAQELNALMSLFVRTLGEITEQQSVSHQMTKTKILAEIDQEVGNDHTQPHISGINKTLDSYGIIDTRSRNNYYNYARRLIDSNFKHAITRIERDRLMNSGVEVA